MSTKKLRKPSIEAAAFLDGVKYVLDKPIKISVEEKKAVSKIYVVKKLPLPNSSKSQSVTRLHFDGKGSLISESIFSLVPSS